MAGVGVAVGSLLRRRIGVERRSAGVRSPDRVSLGLRVLGRGDAVVGGQEETGLGEVPECVRGVRVRPGARTAALPQLIELLTLGASSNVALL
jgi:hypothetical protein